MYKTLFAEAAEKGPSSLQNPRITSTFGKKTKLKIESKPVVKKPARLFSPQAKMDSKNML